ncbi:M20/M25/M40 family metallo-hydrolase [Dokdonia sinensis]|uniref:Carboxypeptidase Q n=1 Tax=Dokdonia sinensis TaxID=2479847 RepID=A0A3M0GUA2_9FLAO|nr:M20/M25/M40 family metallo-hydrolase [Dokdonia sinensis]RMB60906.1 M20/M25/M40 family metallo-hydrolase [Dokdonia sinensis]
MKNFVPILVLFLLSNVLKAQQQDFFYATMSKQHAQELAVEAPDEIELIATNNDIAAVRLSLEGSHLLHEKILAHGPGYIYRTSEREALAVIQSNKRNVRAETEFTISENETVLDVIDRINITTIEEHIIELENYGTRFHNTATGTQAAQDLKARWEAMAATYNRSDVNVRLVEHTNTTMPSVVLTITGTTLPDEFVIVGGHLDSTSGQNQTNAPGADDDASGIATITEATRALFEANFIPQRTIEIMAYAAEEIGLVGSNEIAQQYAANNVNVVAVAQFDMTLFNGSSNDVSFVTDFTNETLNNYMMSLLDHYNASGEHQVTYGTSLCNYGCSDHASWTEQGYMASFPFEANFGDHNGSIHSPNDTFNLINTAAHSVKFAKLCAEFLIEIAKSDASSLGINEEEEPFISLFVFNGKLIYDTSTSTKEYHKLKLYSLDGRLVIQQQVSRKKGEFNTPQLTTGVYIAALESTNGEVVTKKIVVKD